MSPVNRYGLQLRSHECIRKKCSYGAKDVSVQDSAAERDESEVHQGCRRRRRNPHGSGCRCSGHGRQPAPVPSPCGSPGVLSGNVVQVPIHIPVNVCGNTVNVIGLLNPAFGNACIND